MTLLTGVGTQALVSTAAAMGREEEFIRALDQLTVIARSPKPARVLRQHKIHIDVMPPEPYTTADLVNSLENWDLSGQGGSPPALRRPQPPPGPTTAGQGRPGQGSYPLYLGPARRRDPGPVHGRRPGRRRHRRHRLYQPAPGGQPADHRRQSRQGDLPAGLPWAPAPDRPTATETVERWWHRWVRSALAACGRPESRWTWNRNTPTWAAW